MTQKELTEIESQLSFPKGENGIQIAKLMNETNIGMTLASIKNLNIEADNLVLEIGHGNCAHLPQVLEQANNVRYHGLEISETMQKEAIRINKNFYHQNLTKFYLYEGEIIPFSENSYDRIFTVNTLYFWNEPVKFLKEVHRVLKPKGLFIFTFAQKEFMKELPFVKDKFKLFDNQNVHELVQKTKFELIKILNVKDRVKSKSDELVQRSFSVAILMKQK